MKMVVAIDSFKGSASSAELNECVGDVAKLVVPGLQLETVGIADGGEGSLAALEAALGGEMISVETVDLMGEPIEVQYLVIGRQAFIESASVIGIDKVRPSKDTVERASSSGLGAVVRDAVYRGCQEIFLTLGGSGTSDGGLGFLNSLSFDMETFRAEATEAWKQVSFIGLTDVQNVYAGPSGYARVFGAQKGASIEQIDAMDQQACQFAERAKDRAGVDLQATAGTAAAGGLGGAILLLGGRLESGFEKIASLIGLEEKIQVADLVITGEGRLDRQSQQGKVPFGVAQLAKKHGVPVIAVCGSVEREADWLWEEFLAVHSIQTEVLKLEEAMQKERTLANLAFVMKNIFRIYCGK